MAHRKLIAAGLAIITSVLFVVFLTGDKFERARPADTSDLPTEESDNDVVTQNSSSHVETGSEEVATEVEDAAVVGRSLDYFDNEFQGKAIAAVDRYMSERLTNHPNGWVRWRGLVIDPNELTNGDYLDPNLVVKKFVIELFSGLSTTASLTRFTPRDFTASAIWLGEHGNGAGNVKVSMQGNIEGPVKFIFRIRGPEGHYTILPTDMNNVYVVAQGNDSYWSSKEVTH